jgi:GntR family transcriptional repressor for pyruvate dehydrogenase complex
MSDDPVSDDNSRYALDCIRAFLQPDRLGPDLKLPTERTLSEELGVSRRSVRRALEVLEAEGRIWRRQGSGTFAGRGPTTAGKAIDDLAVKSDFMDVMEVRLRIEPPLAQLAAMRASDGDIVRLRAVLERISESTDSDARELWDGAFHRQIAECAGNALFLAVFELVDRVRESAAWLSFREKARSESRLSLYSAQHQAIVEAIAARDPTNAGEAMRQHLLALQESLIRLTSMGLSDAS